MRKIGSKERYFSVDVPGDIYEFGVFEGGTLMILADLGRPTYGYDTFEGIPSYAFDPTLDHDEPGSFTPEHLASNFPPNVTLVKGEFRDTLKDFNPPNKIALLHMDCDLYTSYKEVFEVVTPFLADGARIVIDDVGICKGADKACAEFLDENNLAWEDYPSLIIFKCH